MNASQSSLGTLPQSGGVAYRSVHSMDAVQHSCAMTGWEHVYEPVGLQPFRGQLAELLLGPIQLTLEQIESPMRYDGAMLRGHILFSSVLPTEGTTVFCRGRPLAANTVVKFPRDYAHTAYTNGPIRFMTIVVEEDALTDFVEQRTAGVIRRKDVSERICVVDNELVDRFQMTVQTILEDVALARVPVLDERWRTRTREALLQLLLEIIETSIGAPRQLPPASTRAYIVEKAISYMQGHLNEPGLLESVAHVVKVSSRTLRYAFEEVLGTSPRGFLSALRLHRIHSEISAGASTHSIHQIAHEYGFWHLGRFAQYYRDAFGELPSDTRRRFAGRTRDLNA